MKLPGVKLRKKNGKYYVYINYKKYRKCKCVGSNEAVANQVKSKIEIEMMLGNFNPAKLRDQKDKVVTSYCHKWLRVVGKNTLASRTLEEYKRSLVNHVFPKFGEYQLEQITRGMVKDWIIKMYESGLSMSTIKNAVAPIRIIYSYAYDSELVASNPFQDQKILTQLQKSRPKKQIEIWTPDEANQFLVTAKNMYPDHWMIFFTALNTGCRLGELRGLLVSNFHLSERFIEVHQALTRTDEVKSTKSCTVKRIDISGNVADVFTEYLGQQAIKSIESGINSPYAFHDEKGNPLTEGAIQSRFGRIIKQSGVKTVRIHSMRHYYASMLLMNGCTPIYTAKQLGHSTPEMVYRVYGHYIKTGHDIDIDDCLRCLTAWDKAS